MTRTDNHAARTDIQHTVRLHFSSSQQVRCANPPGQGTRRRSFRETRLPRKGWRGHAVLGIAVCGASRLVLSQVALSTRLAEQVERMTCTARTIEPAIVIDACAAVATPLTATCQDKKMITALH